MSTFHNGPKRYRGADGVMRTLAQTARHLGITEQELRLRWFGAPEPTKVYDDAKYYKKLRRSEPWRDRG
jgi:hypothetical protein